MPSIIFSTLFFIIGILGNKQNFTINTFNEDEKVNCPEATINGHGRNGKLKNSLISILEKDKKYLNPELKITDLCREMNTNRTYVSNLINTEFSLSFNELGDKYRIDHSISLLNDLRNDNYSLQTIATESGFGSLSSFNRAFKKNTGTTVTLYKQKKITAALVVK